MSEMFFVIKVFIFTAVVVALMQIKIGDHNIEQHSQNWLQPSFFTFHHGLDIRHELHQAKEKVEEEASKASDELKSEL